MLLQGQYIKLQLVVDLCVTLCYYKPSTNQPGEQAMNKQWIYRNGEKPFSVTEIKSPFGASFYISMSSGGTLHNHFTSGINMGVITIYDLIPYEPYADFNIDDEVYVKDTEEDNNPLPAHFARLDKDGKPTVFSHGCTSFTASNLTLAWNFCEKANKEDK
jgi:hypothetical protein